MVNSATGISRTMNGSTPSFSGGLAGPTGAEGKSGPSVLAPIPENRWGVFAAGLGDTGDGAIPTQNRPLFIAAYAGATDSLCQTTILLAPFEARRLSSFAGRAYSREKSWPRPLLTLESPRLVRCC